MHIELTDASHTLQLGTLELGAGAKLPDAALEAASRLGPPPTHPMMCHRIDDAALEGVSMQPPQPQTRKWYPGYPGCV